jgi:hypothetical protein
LFIMAVFLGFLLKTAVQYFYVIDNDIEILEKCKDLFEFRKMETLMQRVYFFIKFAKKFVTVAILVFLHDNPHLVILLLIIIQLFFVVYIIQAKPWENEIFNVLEVASELTLVFALLVILNIWQMDLVYKEEMIISSVELTHRENLGWIFIFIFIGLLGVYFLTFLLVPFYNLRTNTENILIALENGNHRSLARFLLKITCARQEIKENLENDVYKKNNQDIAKFKSKKSFDRKKTVIEFEEPSAKKKIVYH